MENTQHPQILATCFRNPVLWGIVFFLGLFPMSLVPSFNLISFYFPLLLTELLLVFGGVCYGTYYFLHQKTSSTAEYARCRRDIITRSLLFLYCYAGLSILWGNYQEQEVVKSCIQLLLVVSIFIFAYSFIMSLDPERIFPFLAHLSVFILFCSGIYIVQSFTGLGFGSNRSVDDLTGVRRLTGPLYTAATGHYILFPSFAFSYFYYINKKTFWDKIILFSCFFVFVTSILALGSRSAILLSALLGFGMLFYRIPHKLEIFIAITIAVVLGFAYYMTSGGKFDRFLLTETSSRFEFMQMIGMFLEHRDWLENIFGKGYGTIWRWRSAIADISLARELSETRSLYIDTPYGYMLFHPHSIFIYTFGELGFLGFLPCILILLVLFIRSFTHTVNTNNVPLGFFYYVLTVSYLLNVFDLMILSNIITSFFWLLFLFGCVRFYNMRKMT